MYQNFTDEAIQVMQLANQNARERGHKYMESEHVLSGLCGIDGCINDIFASQDTSAQAVLHKINRLIRNGDPLGTAVEVINAPGVLRIIADAREEARQMEEEKVSPEHLLLGVLRVGSGTGANALHSFGFSYESVRTCMCQMQIRFGKREVTKLVNEICALTGQSDAVAALRAAKRSVIATNALNAAREAMGN